VSARRTSVRPRCTRCRQTYRPWSSSQRYCGYECYWRSKRRKPEQRRCARAQCLRTFLVGGVRAKPLDQRHCTRHCASLERERLRLRVPRVQRLTLSQRRWVGALVHGEGHIPRGREVFLELGNTEHGMLLDLQRTVGAGSVRRDAPVKGEQPFWRWRLGAVDTVGLLRQIHRYLGGKERDALRLIHVYEARRRLAGPPLRRLLARPAPSSRRHRGPKSPPKRNYRARGKETTDPRDPREAKT
jgi:hypothetical protein